MDQPESSPKTILPECAVCMESYLPPSVPKSLPSCGHTVCLKCLLRLERESDNRYIACPECRTPSKLSRGGVEAFQTNIAIQRIVGQLNGFSLQDSANIARARKYAEIPLSAPSFVSSSKVPVARVVAEKPKHSQHRHSPTQHPHEKRPPKPLPVLGVDPVKS